MEFKRKASSVTFFRVLHFLSFWPLRLRLQFDNSFVFFSTLDAFFMQAWASPDSLFCSDENLIKLFHQNLKQAQRDLKLKSVNKSRQG